ncbi:hypothetical protein ABTX85_08785 [Streptomyces sp. NPDC096097]|uniref:hypothetical protein n=1 Tax=Streptomyces sp. NPDC096097 TaxID=3155546 RepID=UPI003316B9DA
MNTSARRRISGIICAPFLTAGLLSFAGATATVAASQSPAAEASAIVPAQAITDDDDTWEEPTTDANGNVTGESRGSYQEVSPEEGGGYSQSDSVTDYLTGQTTVTTTTVDGNGDGTRHTTIVDGNGDTVPGSDKTDDIKGQGKYGEDDDFGP